MISVGINLSNNKLLSDHVLIVRCMYKIFNVIYDTRVDLVLPERGTVIDLYEAKVWGL